MFNRKRQKLNDKSYVEYQEVIEAESISTPAANVCLGSTSTVLDHLVASQAVRANTMFSPVAAQLEQEDFVPPVFHSLPGAVYTPPSITRVLSSPSTSNSTSSAGSSPTRLFDCFSRGASPAQELIVPEQAAYQKATALMDESENLLGFQY